MNRSKALMSTLWTSICMLSATALLAFTSAPTITSFTPTNGKVGDSVIISGTYLTGASTVKFNGIVSTSITNVTATSLKATVPATATTGKIQVVTPGGTATSIDDYTVWSPNTLDMTVEPGTGYIGALSAITLDYNLFGTENYTGVVSLNAAGKGTISDIRPGTYTLTLYGSHWLRRTINSIDISSNKSIVASLANGDADGGNSVNLFDFVVLDANFGSGYHMADLDGNGVINLFDYVIIDNFFGSLGDVDGKTKLNPKDLAEMVWVSAGEFIMGSGNQYPSDENPQRTVYLNGYWVYKNEVTVAQYKAFCQATTRLMPTAPTWGWQDTHPMVNVTWQEAVDYGSWAGVSLPTEAQWEKAARGIDGRLFPWGNTWDQSKCNNYNSWGISTKPIGSYPSGVSPYGCLDMAGNVWEWCTDWYGSTYYQSTSSINPVGPASGTYRVIRGGSWFNGNSSDFRCATRNYIGPTSRYDDRGFRCVKPQ